MKTMKRLSMILVALLITTGVWADGKKFDLTTGTSEHGTLTFTVNGEAVTTAEEGATVNVKVTANEGFVTKEVTAVAYLDFNDAHAPRRVVNPETLKEIEVTGESDEWSFTMPSANVEVSATYKKVLQESWITLDPESPVYNGEEQEPTVTVKDGDATLKEDVDYTVVEYANNTNAGDATVTITGIGDNYDGTVTVTFTIQPKALEEGMIADIDARTFTGEAQTPAPVLTFNGMTLVEGTDYTVAYADNVDVGTATVTVTGKGNYSGTVTTTFSITNKALTITADDKSILFGESTPKFTVTYDGFSAVETEAVLGGTLTFACDYVKNESGIGEYTITPSGLTSDNYKITFIAGKLTVEAKALTGNMIAPIDALTYNGEAHTPAPVLTYNDMTLVEGTDYTVAYADNVNAGTATVTVTGKGNYSGTATKAFVIEPAGAYLFNLTLSTESFVYDGTAKTPEVTVKDGETVLTEGTDYTIAISNNVNAGTGTVTVTGTGNYYGSKITTFTIEKKALESSMIADIATLAYTGQPLTPAITVTYNGMTLVEGTDYTASYSDNVNPGTAKVTIAAVIGSNYSGRVSTTFTIEAGKTELSSTIAEADKFYGSIKDAYADIAAELLKAINKAKGVLADEEASEQEIIDAINTLKDALQAAKNAVATGIKTIDNSPLTIDNCYTIQGYKVTKSQGNLPKGVYIVNGKKVVTK